jgi:hypothetical protein
MLRPNVKDFACQPGFRKTSDCVCQSSGNLEFATVPWHLPNPRHILSPVPKYVFLYTPLCSWACVIFFSMSYTPLCPYPCNHAKRRANKWLVSCYFAFTIPSSYCQFCISNIPYSNLVPDVPNISSFFKNSVAPVSDFDISVDIDKAAAWLFKLLKYEPRAGLSL